MQVDLTTLTTFRTRSFSCALIELKEISQLPTLAEQLNQQPFIIVGSGSNILFADDYAGTVVVNQLRGRTILSENDHEVFVRFGAGEVWHSIVCEMSASGFYGLENLALIPGTIGAAPVQNIGAYGVEIADMIDSVEAFDLKEGKEKIFSAIECEFAYRDSLFKSPESRDRYIITAVVLKLSKVFNPNLSYSGLNDTASEDITPKQLLERVIRVRRSKLPDPDVLPNAGSFFKNPILSREVLKQVQQVYPDVPYFDIDNDQVKIPAAWLLETAGFKGALRDSGAGVYDKHALILVNRGTAHGRDIYALACDMMAAVKKQFNIDIVPEVRIVGVSKTEGM